jgi:uncharacterized protein YgbK (DUF1537 family)
MQALTAAVPAVRRVECEQVARAVRDSGRVLLVIDDDPTGTQTVHGVPLVTTWTPDDLAWALRQGAPAVWVLANTRSLGPAAAERRVREIVRTAHTASVREGVPLTYVSRGDSTLRGHFPLEPDAIDDELRRLGEPPADAIIVCPAYIEAARVTVDSVHYAATNEGLVPVGETEYARDAAFGYSASDLREYVAEKLGGSVDARDVRAITLHDIRGGGSAVVRQILAGVRAGAPVVVDAVTDDDLRVLSLALIAAEEHGARFILRSGPSLVRARAGIAPAPPLRGRDLLPAGGADRRAAHGLVAVGSHVPLTTRQLGALLALPGVRGIELPVRAVRDLAVADSSAVIEAIAREAVVALAAEDVVVYTSRDVIVTGDGLDVSRAVSTALVDLVRRIVVTGAPAFVIGKGGITSSDLATESLGIRRAWVRGSLLPGLISLWQSVDGPAARTPYVVFAGNVGDDDSLAQVLTLLREAIAQC